MNEVNRTLGERLAASEQTVNSAICEVTASSAIVDETAPQVNDPCKRLDLRQSLLCPRVMNCQSIALPQALCVALTAFEHHTHVKSGNTQGSPRLCPLLIMVESQAACMP
eukprot:1156686-Pelagomonas_calceolata.AAC.8